MKSVYKDHITNMKAADEDTWSHYTGNLAGRDVKPHTCHQAIKLVTSLVHKPLTSNTPRPISRAYRGTWYYI